jgi:transcriptional regulator with XRE-family HTH domain
VAGLQYLTGEQIRAARAIARVDQTELARLSGVSLETIKRLERIHGQVDANIRTLNRIVDAFLSLNVTLQSFEDGRRGVCMKAEAAARQPPARTPEAARPLQRLIYHNAGSPEVAGTLKTVLADIQQELAARNAAAAVTGLLLCRDGRFLHVLEGPRDSVQMMFGAISADARYSPPRLLQNCESPRRKFTDWAMCCGAFEADKQMLGAEPSIEEAFDPGKLSPAAALGLLTVARDMVDESPRRGLDRTNGCSLADRCMDRVCSAT